MPKPETVQAFVIQVEAGDFLGAIRDFYSEDASMQENQSEPRSGRDILLANEAQVMPRATITGKLMDEPVITGDRVAMRWIYTFTRPDGSRRTLEEIAWQRWERERIIEE